MINNITFWCNSRNVSFTLLNRNVTLTRPSPASNYSRYIENFKRSTRCRFSLCLEVSFYFMPVLGPFSDRKPRGG